MSETNKNILYAGIDIAKQTLALDGPGGRCQLANEASGHCRVVKLLGKSTQPVHVIVEASGGYERALVSALHQAQLRVSVVEPRRIRAFARAKAYGPKPIRSMRACCALLVKRSGQSLLCLPRKSSCV